MPMKKTDEFNHLHVHSHFSMLDGHATVKGIVEEVDRLGQKAVAITDHGDMHAAYELQNAAREADIQPIFGIEAYVAPTVTDRHSRQAFQYSDDPSKRSDDVSGGGSYTHMTLLASSNEGLHNLFRMTTRSWTEGFYNKPRMDQELLSQYGKGLIATTGCPSGEIQTRIRLGQYHKAVEYASRMQDIFGKENYFLELMNHNMTIDLERRVIPDLLKLGKDLGIPLLATNDSHYAKQEDHTDHEHLLCMQTGSSMSERPYNEGGRRFAFDGQGYFIKSAAQMREMFPEEHFPGALSNTLLVAEMTQGVEMKYDPELRPHVTPPEGHTEGSYLRELAYKGLSERYNVITEELRERMEFELGVIEDKDFVAYFLVVADFVKWAKDNGVTVGAGRGSVGGSLLAYTLYITELDPIRHNLLFERFLNPERDSPPDIDMDFDDVNRDRVIAYVTDKYGKDSVSSIITFTKLGVKQGIKDSARILEASYDTSNLLTKAVPGAVNGREINFTGIYDPSHERYPEAEDFRNLVDELGATEVVEAARGVEGRVKTWGVHAAGIIVSSKKIEDSIPLLMRNKDGAIITQFDYPTCEALGLIKIDFLGLKNLSIIKDALENVRILTGKTIHMNDIFHSDLADRKTFDLLASGHTLGVFQLDSAGMRELLKRMVTDDFKDIPAVLGLYRPGPMKSNSHNEYADRKNNRVPITYPHPEFNESLEPVLGDTYGLIVYQEQVMKIASVVAGYSLAEADTLRRAMGKKKKSEMDKQWVQFNEGAIAKGYSKEAIQTLWDTLLPFADYGFNLSHAAGYALLSYANAFLKANYPAAYMAALISNETDDKDTTAIYLQECRRMGLKVTTPDVNKSGVASQPVDENIITFGMAGIKGVSDTSSEMIVQARGDAEFSTISDFLSRIPQEVSNKRVLEGLVYSGGFDSFGFPRAALIECIFDANKDANGVKKLAKGGQDSLFSFLDEPLIASEIDVPDLPEYSKSKKLALEREYLGLYVSDHPLSDMMDALATSSDTVVAEIKNGTVESVLGFGGRDAKRIQLAGVISTITRKRAKSGNMFSTVTLEDPTGTIECMLFARTYAKYDSIVKPDHIYSIRGVASIRNEGDTPTIVVDSVEEIEMTDSGKFPMFIRLTEQQCTAEAMLDLQKCLNRHPGDSPVRISVRSSEKINVIELPAELAVTPSPGLVQELQALFGVECRGKW